MNKIKMLIAIFTALFAVNSRASANSYPTEATAEYVMTCMATNGQTPDALRRCSCSIDAIASAIPYDVYERADTILKMYASTGQSASLFRETPMFKTILDQLRAAQVEADFRCF